MGQNCILNTPVFELSNAPQHEVQEWPVCHPHVSDAHVQGYHFKCQTEIPQEGNCNF